MEVKFLQIIVLIFPALFSAQTQTYRAENNKWGILENENIIIPPVYDTIFNFDKEEKVCLACYRIKTTTTRNLMTITTTNHYCRYLNKNNNSLVIKINNNTDTCSVFQLTKSALDFYNQNSCFAVSAKNKKYMVDKNFNQLTFVPYHNIALSADSNFYLAEFKNEGDIVFTGLVDLHEKQIVPFDYSSIKLNVQDSLIIACSAGVRNNGTDDVFDFSGKKIASYKMHVNNATKNFIIHKVFEPKERFIIRNLKTDTETELKADEVQTYRNDTILIKQKHDWFFYNMNNNQKTPYKN